MKTGIVILIILLTGCVTQKRCLTKFPPVNDTIRIVILKDSIIYRDTTIFIHLPGQTTIDSVVIPCPAPPPEFIPDTAKAETSLAFARAWFAYPNIQLRLVQTDTTIVARLDSAIMESYFWHNEYEQIKQTIIVKKIPLIYKIAFWTWIGVLVLILWSFLMYLKKVFFPRIKI